MSKGRKIRNLVESDGAIITLNDVIMKAASMSGDLINLEYGNKKSDLKRAKKSSRELRKLAEEFDRRIRTEVFEEVHDYAIEKNKRYKRDPDAFKEE